MSDDPTRTYYDERYHLEGGQTFPADPSRYRSWLGSLLDDDGAGRSLLDFGCGVGYVCSLFADCGYTVFGVDISRAAVKLAEERDPRARFLVVESDRPLPFDDEHFDVITCLGVIEHVAQPESIVAELRRVALDGAIGIWVLPNARSPFFWFGHGTEQVEEHPRSLDGWRKLLTDAGWEVVAVTRDPGPLDRATAGWKRVAQRVLNRLPLELTYQFVIETRAA